MGQPSQSTRRIGPADSSERAHALEMLEELPANSLLTADAGFTGYDFAKTVLQSGCELLIRVGSNLTLLKKLGYVRESGGTVFVPAGKTDRVLTVWLREAECNDFIRIVYVWPDKAARGQQPPLVFRLVVAQGPRHPIYFITSVTSRNVLTDAQVAELYRCRWGIEVFCRVFKKSTLPVSWELAKTSWNVIFADTRNTKVFYRHLKQTFGRRKLPEIYAVIPRRMRVSNWNGRWSGCGPLDYLLRANLCCKTFRWNA